MVRYPFESTSGRVNKYLIVSFFLALIPASFEDFQNVNYNTATIGFSIGIALRTIFVLTFIVSVAYTCKKLSGPSFSKEVRQLVLKKHIVTVVLFLLTNSYFVVNEIVFLTTPDDEILPKWG